MGWLSGCVGGALAVGLAALLTACAVGKEPPAPTPMVRIAAGEFSFGPEEPCYRDGDNPCTSADGSWQRLELSNPYPSVRVRFDEPFYLDAFEVTNAQYAYCVAMGACSEPIAVNAPNLKTQGDYYNDEQFANYPVVQVTWKMAHDYCDFVGKRLPTELEWERAAKGLLSQAPTKHKGRVYPVDAIAGSTNHEDCLKWGLPTAFCATGGSDLIQPEPAPDHDGVWTATTQDFVTEPDGGGPTAGKIYYLFGNVSEWTEDLWRERPTCAGDPPHTPCWGCDGRGGCESLCTSCDDGRCHFACGGADHGEPDISNPVETVVCSAYTEDAQPLSPSAIKAGKDSDSTLRVIRGGNVTDDAGWGCLARSAGRDRVKKNPAYVPTMGFPEVGFRCAADEPPAAE